jgi:hypothetical protein
MKKLFSPATLAMMSNVMASAMDDECDVIEIPETRGRGGVTIRGEPKKIATLRCSFHFATDATAELRDDAMKIDARYIVSLPLYANVKLGHRLIVRGNRPAAWQRSVDVVGVTAPHSHRTRRFVLANDAKDA